MPSSTIEAIFSGDMCSKIRCFVWGLTKCLAQTASETFDTFDGSVGSDATKTTCFDGSVHPLTRYVKYLFGTHLRRTKNKKILFLFSFALQLVLEKVEQSMRSQGTSLFDWIEFFPTGFFT
ncbi:exocyst complex component EXO70A1-like isoform X1 [Dioscorea cayenensis subsp. rotundata]|uniref:Exocyst complex component EXO70A1-like isoform X1 n=1 Tax=Dioscorea cayennensis subsp. rotundata TaxID=55577 RepID=A0AB40D3N8_DIOCR|nr:exocyst complex component EXO70A1-like isoform X1 [Dioscorea cayenensis subsp. rotundata]